MSGRRRLRPNRHLGRRGSGPGDNSGRYWGDLANWSGVTEAPVGSNFSITFNNDFLSGTGQRNVLLATSGGADSAITIGNITFSNATSGNRSYNINNLSGGSGTLIIDSGSVGVASKLKVYTGATNTQTFNVAVQLDSSLEFDIGSPSTGTTNNLLVFNGSLSGIGGVTTASTHLYRALFNAANSYTGDTTLTNAQLVVGAASTSAPASMPITIIADARRPAHRPDRRRRRTS